MEFLKEMPPQELLVQIVVLLMGRLHTTQVVLTQAELRDSYVMHPDSCLDILARDDQVMLRIAGDDKGKVVN
jgi:hypothetical protein